MGKLFLLQALFGLVVGGVIEYLHRTKPQEERLRVRWLALVVCSAALLLYAYYLGSTLNELSPSDLAMLGSIGVALCAGAVSFFARRKLASRKRPTAPP
jgi:peptidoglycan/LPS O-acetylase OafA/YrhL